MHIVNFSCDINDIFCLVIWNMTIVVRCNHFTLRLVKLDTPHWSWPTHHLPIRLEADVRHPLFFHPPVVASTQRVSTYGSLTARTIYSVVEGMRALFISITLALLYELDLQTLRHFFLLYQYIYSCPSISLLPFSRFSPVLRFHQPNLVNKYL